MCVGFGKKCFMKLNTDSKGDSVYGFADLVCGSGV